MNEKKCQFIINNCDCGGIKKLLNIENIKFDTCDYDYDTSKLKQLILQYIF